jgi:hypothetical protein
VLRVPLTRDGLDLRAVFLQPRFGFLQRVAFVAITAAAGVEVRHQRIEVLDFVALVTIQQRPNRIDPSQLRQTVAQLLV